MEEVARDLGVGDVGQRWAWGVSVRAWRGRDRGSGAKVRGGGGGLSRKC